MRLVRSAISAAFSAATSSGRSSRAAAMPESNHKSGRARRRLRWPPDDNYNGRLGFAEADVSNVPPRSRGNIECPASGSLTARSGGIWTHAKTDTSDPLNEPPTRARARATGPLFVEFPGFSPRPEPSGDVKECSHTVYRLPSQEVASVARHRRQRCASRRAPMAAVEGFYPGRWRYRTTATWRLSFHCGMNAADTSAWRGPAPRDRRGVGRLPSRSALIWTTTRSRAGGAGAIETPTPGAVSDFVPVVGR